TPRELHDPNPHLADPYYIAPQKPAMIFSGSTASSKQPEFRRKSHDYQQTLLPPTLAALAGLHQPARCTLLKCVQCQRSRGCSRQFRSTETNDCPCTWSGGRQLQLERCRGAPAA